MKSLAIVVLLSSLMFCFGFMGSCGAGVGGVISGSDESSGPQPTHKLNYSNMSNRQECLDRGGEWVKVPKLVEGGKTYYGKQCQIK